MQCAAAATLTLLGGQLLGAMTELVAHQALDQQAQLVVLGVHFVQHLPQQGGVVRQGFGRNLHRAVMNDAAASVPEFVASGHEIYPASSGWRRAAGARHSHPSSSAASCAEDSVIRPVVLADGQAN